MHGRVLLYLLLTLVVSPGWATEHAGVVVFALGSVSAVDDSGIARNLNKSEHVYAGDTLVTVDGQVQIRLLDGGFVGLQKHTRFRIDEFAYVDTADEDQRSFFTLLLGGFRTITGAIGKTRHTNYKVATTVATIGIRGTIYRANLCVASCLDLGGNPKPDGLYLDTTKGKNVLFNDAGEVEIAEGSSAYVSDRRSRAEVTAKSQGTQNIQTIPALEKPEFRAGESFGLDPDLPGVIDTTPGPTY